MKTAEELITVSENLKGKVATSMRMIYNKSVIRNR